MKKIIGIIIALAIVAVGVYFYTQNKSVVLPVMQEKIETGGEQTAMTEGVIFYSDNGFSPNVVTIKKGGKVIFKNDSSKPMWVASAKHPQHDEYESTNITKCGMAEAVTMFDMCKEYEPGTSWAFQFDNAGEWRFHDHISPSYFGKVKVVE